MYLAKEERTGVEEYVADRDRNSASRLALLGGLRNALEKGEQSGVWLAERQLRREKSLGLPGLRVAVLGPKTLVPGRREARHPDLERVTGVGLHAPADGGDGLGEGLAVHEPRLADDARACNRKLITRHVYPLEI